MSRVSNGLVSFALAGRAFGGPMVPTWFLKENSNQVKPPGAHPRVG